MSWVFGNVTDAIARKIHLRALNLHRIAEISPPNITFWGDWILLGKEAHPTFFHVLSFAPC